MSFGTGHHDTTVLMAKYLLSLPHPLPKRIIDAGTGTGILAILAEKLGAKEIIAFDIDEWSVMNAQENITLNHCQNIKISQNTIQNVEANGKFDVLIANIQRNVLFDEMETYSEKLNTEGILLLSGFYEKDKEYLIERAKQFQLIYQSHQIQNDWCGLCFKKI
jgi:ribosomal protein L11 methyltransferase